MRKTSYLDDDDDAEIGDGESVVVPLHLMDATQRAVAGVDLHQPGYRRVTDAAVRDARTAAREARDQMIERATSAWRLPQRDPHKDAAEPDAGSPPGVMRAHLRGTDPDEPDEPDADDVQGRRDAIWNDYKTRLANAWKTDPRAATAIERQGERWRGGR